ncbi:MAG: hypothetical protein QM479_09415 [Pseudomonadota bacterium]
MMFAATDLSLINLIENKQVMYAVVDYMDQNNTELVSETVYIQAVRKLIYSKIKKTEKQRLAKIFDLDNLVSTGLVIDIDKSSRKILFHTAVIEVFRLFDSKRLRELTNADLQELSARLDNAKSNLLTHISDREKSPDLDEQIEMVFLLLSDISSKLQTNTRSLQSKAHRLAETIDAHHDVTTLQEVQQKHHTLAEIQKIYQRNILPMLEFLNEYEQMKNLTPLKKIAAIHQIFSDFGYNDEAYRVQQYKISITTHYKAIDEISQLLERYSRQQQVYRKQYNSIEIAYQQLLESAARLSDAKLNTQFFNTDETTFNLSEAYFGIKHYRSAQKGLINWADINHQAYLEEYLLNAQQRVLDEAQSVEVKIQLDQALHLQQQQQQQQKKQLEQFINNLNITAPVNDIYREVLAHMQAHLNSVNLSDVLLVSKKLQLQQNIRFKVHFELPQSVLIHNNQKLTYWRRELLEES